MEDQFNDLFPSANEVCEGYVFTGVCLSTRGGGRGLGLCPGGGSPSKGVSVQRVLCPGEGVTNGRYVCYWNAFLVDFTLAFMARLFFRH